MTELADRIATRLIVEKGYAILADRDDYPVLPEESELKARLQQEQDEAKARQIAEEWSEADRQFLRQQPLLGGPLDVFPQLIDREVHQSDILRVSRTLRSLTRQCARVLISPSINPIRIALIVEGDIPADLVPSGFAANSRAIQRELDYDPWDDDPDEEEDHDYRSKLLLEVMVLDSGRQAPRTRQRLRRLADDAHKTRGVLVQAFHTNRQNGKTWTNAILKGWRQAWFIRHAVRQPMGDLDTVLNRLSGPRKPWLRIATVVLFMLAASLTARFLLPVTDLWAGLLRDIVVPGSVLPLCCYLQRVRTRHNTDLIWAPPLYIGLLLLTLTVFPSLAGGETTGGFNFELMIDMVYTYFWLHMFAGVSTVFIREDTPVRCDPVAPA